MKEIVSWTFPFEQEEEKKRSVILRWCPESDSIAVSIDNVVRILSIVSTSQNDVKLSGGHEGFVTDISWLPRLEKNDHLLLTTSSDRTAQIWHVESRTPLRNLRGPTGSSYVGTLVFERLVTRISMVSQENLSKSKHDITKTILEHRYLA